MLKYWSPEVQYEWKHIVFKTIPVELESGKIIQYEYISRKNIHGIVAVLPVTTNKEIILILQYRIPAGQKVLEVPAGLMDKKWELQEDTVRRELLEETWYEAGDVIYTYQTLSSSWLADELVDCYIARDCYLSDKVHELDEIEQIEVVKVPIWEAYRYLREQKEKWVIIDSKVFWLLGIYLWFWV